MQSVYYGESWHGYFLEIRMYQAVKGSTLTRPIKIDFLLTSESIQCCFIFEALWFQLLLELHKKSDFYNIKICLDRFYIPLSTLCPIPFLSYHPPIGLQHRLQCLSDSLQQRHLYP